MSVRRSSERLPRYPTTAASIGGKGGELLVPTCLPWRAGWDVCRCGLCLTMFEREWDLPIHAIGICWPKP